MLNEIQQLRSHCNQIERKIKYLESIDDDFISECVFSTHKNVSKINIIKSCTDIPEYIKNKNNLLGLKSYNCNVILSFGGLEIPIFNKEILFCISLRYKMLHDFDILITPIDINKDYSIELKFSDKTVYLDGDILDVNNNSVLGNVRCVCGLFGTKL